MTPLASALDRVGDRWSLLLVDALLESPLRFNELIDALPGIAPNILTDRVRRLERTGIVRSVPYSQRPPRVEYTLTADGRDLAGALRLLADWGGRRGAAGAEGDGDLHHATCGTRLQARWYCPTCSVSVADDEAADLPVL